MPRCLWILWIFQRKNLIQIPPIDFTRSEITDIVVLVRNWWCFYRVPQQMVVIFVPVCEFHVPACTKSPIWRSDIATFFPFSSVTLADCAKQLLSQPQTQHVPRVVLLQQDPEHQSSQSRHCESQSSSLYWLEKVLI